MTNIEEYAGKRERQRAQSNLPTASFSHLGDQLFLRAAHPEPGLGGCEAYDFRDLSIDNGQAQDFQGILDEDPNLDPHIVELRQIVWQRKALLAQYRRQLSEEYQRLVATCRVPKTYWHAGPVKRRWRKAWFKKQWVGWKLVSAKQYLKPRVIAYRRLVSFDLSTGVKTYEIARKTIRPHRWVYVRKPKFVWRLIRPAMLVPYKPRVSEIRMVVDWNLVRKRFAAFKLQLIDLRLQIHDLRQQSLQLRRMLVRRPKLAASWTTSGFVMPPTITVPLLLPYAGSEYSLGFLWPSDVYLRHYFPPYQRDGKHHNEVATLCPEATGWGSSPEIAIRIAEEHSYMPHKAYRTVGIESDRVKLGLGDRVNTSLIGPSQLLLEKATHEAHRELRAYASLVSLTKARDYTFQIVRSMGELKDSRSTFKQAWDFLKWLKRPSIKGLTPKKVYAGIAGAYLAWKFAIQPTIQDVQTVVDNTVEFLTDLRRSLRELVDDLRSGSSIYHARAAYASGNGVVSGRVRLHADNASFRDLQYSVSWTRTYNHPVPVVARFMGSADDDIAVTPVSDPTNRGAQIIPVPYGSSDPIYSADITEEADNGQKWRRQFDGDVFWIYSGDPSEDQEGASKHAHLVQRLHSLAIPYDVRDIASGVLFASYHADDIIRVASEGRLSLGTIMRYMDQLTAVESWLKNPEAQKAAVKELFRHTDFLYVTWQLTPLSFVYDWFTTSGTIVEALNSLNRSNIEVIPQPLHGVWQSERHELLSVVPNLRLKERKCRELVREWTVVDCSRRDNELHYYFAAPARSTIFNDLTWEPSPGTAVFSRTGLYRFRRGEYHPQGLDKIDAYMPKLRLDIDRGKLVTLSAMLSGFLNA